MDRRRFLGTGSLLGASSFLPAGIAAAHHGEPTSADAPRLLTSPEARGVHFSADETTVPDEGWYLWPDRAAAWQNDTIYLPQDVHLASLPVNAPTGGWKALDPARALPVTLPSTVEQFFWGSTGFRPYHDEYKFEATDSEVKNGAYYGVSWWWRQLHVPASFTGKRVVLHIRGARQRAEVYLNQTLVGYSIMEELPFESDLTPALRPGGPNQLAIRITNPGGRLDWVDNVRMVWGGFELQKSHGFGGLDRGLVLSAHRTVRFTDLWALNTPTPKQITAHAMLEVLGPSAVNGQLRFTVLPLTGAGPALAEFSMACRVEPGPETSRAAPPHAVLNAPTAALWDLETPHVYRLRAEFIPEGETRPVARREQDFGFRWIAPEGIGSNAILRLNGRRIRIYTSISWGFWALNGLFPLPALAEKEVRAAKHAFGLNTLNFHRNLGKEDVLYVQDRLGLMRCLEPGGGAQALVPEASHPGVQRYTRAKIAGMIRAFRSHPSVVHYIIQNEVTLDPNSAEVSSLFALMQVEDPSRTIVGNDGFVMRSPQAWTEPYASVFDGGLHRSAGKATVDGGAGGWWVDHTGHFSDVWQDTYYNSPEDFFYGTRVRGEIVEWGEMKGAASIDNHVSVLEQIRRHGGHSYDKLDHEEQLAAYERFLDAGGFRKDFPDVQGLFRSIGKRAYESWGQFLENVRLCDENDMCAVSGWESTAMENHSGLVDNFRDEKSDPAPLREALLPVHPVAKQRSLVVRVGERVRLDPWLLNDTGVTVTGELRLEIVSPAGTVSRIATYAAPEQHPDQLSYLLGPTVETPPLNTAGFWTTRFALDRGSSSVHRVKLLAVDTISPKLRPIRVGIARLAPEVEKALRSVAQLIVVPFASGERVDVIVGSGGTANASKDLATDAEGAYKPGAGPLPEFTLPDEVFAAVKAGVPLLAVTPTDGQSIGVARQLAAAGAFTFHGMVGASRASWMGSWYFPKTHPLYEGMPTGEAMGIHYQVKGGGSNGWMVEGERVQIVCGYGRDHDRNLGAGTFVSRVGSTPVVMHRIADMHPVLLERFLANALVFLTEAS